MSPKRYKSGDGKYVIAMRWDGTPECEHAMWAWTNGRAHWVNKRRAFGFTDGTMIRHVGVGDWLVSDNGALFIANDAQMKLLYTEAPNEDQPHVVTTE